MITENPTPITRETFTQALREAVAERGEDYVYPKEQEGWTSESLGLCVYQTPEGEPACIIGVALHKLGQPIPEHDSVSPASVVLGDRGSKDRTLQLAARSAQEAQDRGASWGFALAIYEAHLEVGEAE